MAAWASSTDLAGCLMAGEGTVPNLEAGASRGASAGAGAGMGASSVAIVDAGADATATTPLVGIGFMDFDLVGLFVALMGVGRNAGGGLSATGALDGVQEAAADVGGPAGEADANFGRKRELRSEAVPPWAQGGMAAGCGGEASQIGADRTSPCLRDPLATLSALKSHATCSASGPSAASRSVALASGVSQ